VEGTVQEHQWIPKATNVPNPIHALLYFPYTYIAIIKFNL
jgi:hypothetical protein